MFKKYVKNLEHVSQVKRRGNNNIGELTFYLSHNLKRASGMVIRLANKVTNMKIANDVWRLATR